MGPQHSLGVAIAVRQALGDEGLGVPGDSGSWLMRRSDNAVVGLVWARNHNYGSPVERIRLTYVTAIVDILADMGRGR